MKHFVLAIISAALIPVFTGCASTSEGDQQTALKKAISQDIERYISKYDRSVENRPCQFSNLGTETVFRNIPFINQQAAVPCISYKLENQTSKNVVQCTLAREYKMRQVRTAPDGTTVTGVLLLNNRKVYSSPDGVHFKEITDPLMINAMRFNYILAMDLERHVKNVAIETVDVYKLEPKTTNWLIVKEPVEILIDNERCYRVDMDVINSDFEAKLVMYIRSDDRAPIRLEISPVKGLPATCTKTILMQNFIYSRDNIVFPYQISIFKDAKNTSVFRKSKVLVNNGEIDQSLFLPAVPAAK